MTHWCVSARWEASCNEPHWTSDAWRNHIVTKPHLASCKTESSHLVSGCYISNLHEYLSIRIYDVCYQNTSWNQFVSWSLLLKVDSYGDHFCWKLNTLVVLRNVFCIVSYTFHMALVSLFLLDGVSQPRIEVLQVRLDVLDVAQSQIMKRRTSETSALKKEPNTLRPPLSSLFLKLCSCESKFETQTSSAAIHSFLTGSFYL